MDAAGRRQTIAAAPSNRPLLVCAPRTTADNLRVEEPMSPTGRVMEDMGIYGICMMGLDTPVNLSIFRTGIETELLTRYPRFRSIQVPDGSKNGKPRWVQTNVNLDDHIIIPEVDPAAVASDPDQAMEDYVASLSMLPMDRGRPLWEFHILDFPTSEATSTVVLRMHHSIGDGMSVTTLFMASSRSTADQTRLPAMPPTPTRTGAIYEPPRPPLSAGAALAFLSWLGSYFVLAWHTLVDAALLLAKILFLRDPKTLLKRADDGDFNRKRFVHRTLSLDGVKFLRTAMNCTINDVLVGLTSAALSRYYFRKSGDTKRICLRSIVMVNTRPTSTHQALTVHYHNYGSIIKVVLAVDEAQFPDCHLLLNDFSESMKLIKDAADLNSLNASTKNV